MKQIRPLLIAFLLVCVSGVYAQNSIADSVRNILRQFQREYGSALSCRLLSVEVDTRRRQVNISLSDQATAIPFHETDIDFLRAKIRRLLPPKQQHYNINIYAGGDNIEKLVPNIYRKHIDKDKTRYAKDIRKSGRYLVRNLSKHTTDIDGGLVGSNIALWHSHGWYYEQRLDRWEWQRARILTTVEDKFTAQIVINYLLPMLENAGAYVFVPRERDIQTDMVICDNDPSWRTTQQGSIYRHTGKRSNIQKRAVVGFADSKEFYVDRDNPFVMGTAVVMKSTRKAESWVEYIPKLSACGWYSVSVCYPHIDGAVHDAHYTVYHSGGHSSFAVDQSIAYGTWVYLGTFYFDPDDNEANRKVVLSNESRKGGGFVAADAVKFGGGMGNIARRPATQSTIDSIEDPTVRARAKLLSPFAKESFVTSRRARFWEGARYYLQWAGMPFSVYSHTYGMNDYIDDYAARGKWVNYLNYASDNAPDSVGLAVPIDLSLALHSDAGIDTAATVGSLAIVTTSNNGSATFPNGQSRYASMDMANIILSEIKRDVRATSDREWAIRGIKSANYAESRMPSVPSMILESMSHQNFNDMKRGLDPKFQFIFARAVYKGILKFLAHQRHTHYTVQPLPVRKFSALLSGNTAHLQWSATHDTTEATAKPSGYMVYTRKNAVGEGYKGYDNGVWVRGTHINLPVGDDTIYSYKVTAVNDGGESFPSEELSVCRRSGAQGEVLVVNGFTKVAAADYVDEGSTKGFLDDQCGAIPYRVDYSYTGKQYIYDTSKKWTDDDSPGYGASYGTYEQLAVAGNTFDYPYTHGSAISEAGYSFSSSSVEAVEDGSVSLGDFSAIDLILGKQLRRTDSFTDKEEFHTIGKSLQGRLSQYLSEGKGLFVSGAYVAKDLYEKGDGADSAFAADKLKILWRTDRAARRCNTTGVYSPVLDMEGLECDNISDKINATRYALQSVDALEPRAENCYTVMRYNENSMSAAVAYKGEYRAVVAGFPFETISKRDERTQLMRRILTFLHSK